MQEPTDTAAETGRNTDDDTTEIESTSEAFTPEDPWVDEFNKQLTPKLILQCFHFDSRSRRELYLYNALFCASVPNVEEVDGIRRTMQPEQAERALHVSRTCGLFDNLQRFEGDEFSLINVCSGGCSQAYLKLRRVTLRKNRRSKTG